MISGSTRSPLWTWPLFRPRGSGTAKCYLNAGMEASVQGRILWKSKGSQWLPATSRLWSHCTLPTTAAFPSIPHHPELALSLPHEQAVLTAVITLPKGLVARQGHRGRSDR